MKIFISWSGKRSKTVAETLKLWLKDIFHIVDPWISSEDIQVGARWNNDVAYKLEECRLGILCLTKENINEPWILFEAGALAKTLADTLVIPYLIDLKPTDIQGPLVQFQAARAVKEDTLKLVHTINQSLGENAKSKEIIERSFEKWWPDLEEATKRIHRSEASIDELRSDRDIIEEILELIRASGIVRSTKISRGNLLQRLFGENIGFFTGQDIKVLSSKLSSCGQKDDPNATQWVTPAKLHGSGKIDGYWGSRWSGGNLNGSWVTGNARVETNKDYVYIIHRDIRTDCFLACHRVEENVLLGRWLNIFHPEESTPYVAKIVSNNRIDGFWSEGRWDLQRVDK